MTRTISILLIAAIALQTVGCSTWKPLARTNDVPEDAKQTVMQGEFPGKLKEGMRATIKFRPLPAHRSRVELSSVLSKRSVQHR